MKTLKQEKKFFWPHAIAIFLVIVASICFYNLKTMRLYLIMCIGSMLISFYSTLQERSWKIFQEKGVVYLVLLYSIYTFYGVLFLRAGEYNWDKIVFTCFQDVGIYCSFRHFFSYNDWYKRISIPFAVAAVFVVLYIVTLQQELIFQAQVEQRIGLGMSGNVNTVGYSMGIVSFALAYLYCIKRNKQIFLVLIPLLFLMLLTGSKKTIIIIVIDILTLYFYSRAKVSSFIMVALFMSVLIWVVFENPYFYEVLGKRIEDMYTTITGQGTGDYSHSTDDRSGMIADAFTLGMNSPILGGGMNYFAYASRMYGYYGYSHCNYTELFCNFGIVGVLIYYIPYFRNINFFWKIRKNEWDKSVFAIMWLVMSLFLGWSMVAFSSLCMSYIPIVAAFALKESVMDKRILLCRK